MTDGAVSFPEEKVQGGKGENGVEQKREMMGIKEKHRNLC